MARSEETVDDVKKHPERSEEQQEEDQEDARRGEDAQAARHLEHVTDYVEERHIDISKAANVISNLASEEKESQASRASRELELRSVVVNAEHVNLVAREMEISEEKADRALREHGGDAIATLRSLISAGCKN